MKSEVAKLHSLLRGMLYSCHLLASGGPVPRVLQGETAGNVWSVLQENLGGSYRRHFKVARSVDLQARQSLYHILEKALLKEDLHLLSRDPQPREWTDVGREWSRLQSGLRAASLP